MNKSELIDTLADVSGESKAAVGRVLDGFVSTVGQQLKKGESIVLPGFGSFKPTKRAARVGRNPSTGATIKVAASNGAKFTAGATLKATLNPKKKK